MTDEKIQNTIEVLVMEKQMLLRAKPDAQWADRQRRLMAVRTELDRSWDLLRQRRARREFRFNPDQASLRDAATVAAYLQ